MTTLIRDITFRNGRPTSGAGGNLIVNGVQLTLDRVRVTGGLAPAGGGIQVNASNAAATLTVLHSLIDNNVATTGNDGGGLISLAISNSATMSFQDSTIAFNTADRGGGVYMTSTNGIILRGATVAYNRARSGGTGGVGGIQSSTTVQQATIQGSLFAANTTTINTGNQTLTPTLNCSFGTTTADGGGNVEDADQCGLGAGSRRSAVPQLATALDATQQPPTLNIPETSPAIDFAACGTRTTDQRGMTRPLGATCDAGAYEFDPRPDTSIASAAPPFTLSSSDPDSSFQCSLDGGAFVACATPYNPGAAPGTHTLTVRAVDAQGNIDPTPATTTFTVAAPPTPTASPTPTPTPTPVVNKTVVVRELKGTIKVKLPGAKSYINLDVTRGIPVGSTVDTRDGTVELTSVPKAGAPPETAKFFDGIFKVTQSKGITTLTLTETLAACPKSKTANAAAGKPKKRRLWGDGKGKFRTEGKYAAATVRGTKWLVEDTCAGTLVKVNVGVVDVRDNVRHKTIVVRKGKSYLARPKR